MEEENTPNIETTVVENEDTGETIEEPVPEPPPESILKPKRTRTEKQKVAFKKCQESRAKKVADRKEEKRIEKEQKKNNKSKDNVIETPPEPVVHKKTENEKEEHQSRVFTARGRVRRGGRGHLRPETPQAETAGDQSRVCQRRRK